MGTKEFLQEDEAQQTLERLSNTIQQLTRHVELLDIFLAPKSENLMFEKPFQIATVQPGQEQEVYRQDVRRGFVGVITHIGNDWFANTSLSRLIDGVVSEQPIQRQIAPVNQPLAVKIFVTREVIWTAKNSDAVPRTFGVLTAGYFIPEDVYYRSVGVEG